MNIHAQANVAVRQPYTGFDRLPIAGQWRRPNKRMVEDLDPYSGEVIAEIPQGDRTDLDTAYAAAAGAQDAWASELPSVREGVFRHAAAIFEARREEIVSWLIRESGSTRLKANLEWASSHAILLWATSALISSAGGSCPPTFAAKRAGCIVSRSALSG
jgi:aldehyde dehydrogenase (NAD+)